MYCRLVPTLEGLLINFPNACIKIGAYEDDISLKIDVLNRLKIEIYTPGRRMIGAWDKVTGKLKRTFTTQEFTSEQNLPTPPDYMKVTDILQLLEPSRRKVKII